MVAIGLSKYQEAGRDLVYPVADATALARFFQGAPGRFTRVEAKVLADQQATREGILAARAFLARAGPDDTCGGAAGRPRIARFQRRVLFRFL